MSKLSMSENYPGHPSRNEHPQHIVAALARVWLRPENRCLVPANGFAEYAPESTLRQ
jgi:putative SOS response-associated peptidase YedK